MNSLAENRFTEIEELQDGWFDGYGVKFKNEDISFAKEIYYLLEKLNIYPRIYPNPDNEISLEWEEVDNSISLYIDFSHSNILILYKNKELDLPMNASFLLKKIEVFIKNLKGENYEK